MQLWHKLKNCTASNLLLQTSKATLTRSSQLRTKRMKPWTKQRLSTTRSAKRTTTRSNSDSTASPKPSKSIARASFKLY
jgi:hypothetical protein